MKSKLQKSIKAIKQKYRHLAMLTYAMLFSFRMKIYAHAALSDIPLVSGSMELLGDAQPIAIGLGIAISSVLCIYRGIKWNAADDQEKPRAWKSLLMTVLGGILITTAVGTLTGICAYYTNGTGGV